MDSQDHQERLDPHVQRRTMPWKTVLRALIITLVALGLGWSLFKAVGDLRDTEFQWSDIRIGALLAAVALYSLVMLLAGAFWHRLLKATGHDVALGPALLAFFASQLGKYVPGKAMVVIIRTGMVNRLGADVRTAAATVFVETLTWIFVGSTIGSALLFWEVEGMQPLRYGAVGLAAAAGLLTWPPIFRAIAGRMIGDRGALSGIGWRVMLFGWTAMSTGWAINGLCLWLVLYSLPFSELGAIGFDWADYRLCLACVTLATVAGFVSLLPGGLGVRELVIIPLLSARFGMAVAFAGAVLLRFVWLASELGTSGIIYLWQRNRER